MAVNRAASNPAASARYLGLNQAAKHSGAASQHHAGYGIAAKQFLANPLARNSARRQTPAASSPARSARYLGLNQAATCVSVPSSTTYTPVIVVRLLSSTVLCPVS
jgi:hypothetical protein